MYVHTKLANKCVVTEKTEKQHIIETIDGYIIRCIIYDDCYCVSAVLNNHRYIQVVNRVTVPRGDYKSLRAAVKSFVSLAPMYKQWHAAAY